MDKQTERLYPSGPFENNDLKKQLEQKLNDVNSFNDSINNIEEMITYFKENTINQNRDIENIKL